jgi:hypothetical protein
MFIPICTEKTDNSGAMYSPTNHEVSFVHADREECVAWLEELRSSWDDCDDLCNWWLWSWDAEEGVAMCEQLT